MPISVPVFIDNQWDMALAAIVPYLKGAVVYAVCGKYFLYLFSHLVQLLYADSLFHFDVRFEMNLFFVELPQVQVMYIVHAFKSFYLLDNHRDVHPFRSGLHQDANRFV